MRRKQDPHGKLFLFFFFAEQKTNTHKQKKTCTLKKLEKFAVTLLTNKEECLFSSIFVNKVKAETHSFLFNVWNFHQLWNKNPTLKAIS